MRRQPLDVVLDRLLVIAAGENPQLPGLMQPGIDRSAVDSMLAAVGFTGRPPLEWYAAYAWSNGTVGDDTESPLFYYHRFLPLSEALSIHATWRQYDPSLSARSDYDLLPIFSFCGEYYAIECASSSAATAAIHFYFQGDLVAYDSLTSMLHAILDCYRQGAYPLVDGEVRPDRPRIAAIKAHWNRCRASTFMASEDHP